MLLSAYLSSNRGRAAGLARALGVRPVVVSRWVRGIRPVPVERCTAIECATNGAVTRIDLRPDDWRDIWPELAEFAQNDVQTLATQAPAAINPVAQEVANV